MPAVWRLLAGLGATLVLGCAAPAPLSQTPASVALRSALAAGADPFEPSPAAAIEPLEGHWAGGDRWLDIFTAEGTVYGRTEGVARGSLRRRGEVLDLARPAGAIEHLRMIAADWLRWGDVFLQRRETPRPPPPPVADWMRIIGGYRRIDDAGGPVFLVQERRGYLYLQVGDRLLDRIETGQALTLGSDSWSPGTELRFARDTAGTATQMHLGDLDLVPALPVGIVSASSRISPRLPVAQLRESALQASPPRERGSFRTPDLVDLRELDPGIRFDIRYATTNNFIGSVLYESPGAFLQRPAAEALRRVQQALAPRGYGLLIHDAYRPWYVTKMFWDATPEAQRIFVADPARGSRHNRGCAVDLTLYDLATGESVSMTGGYDEFSMRSYPFFAGGTSRQRWHRDLLRQAMQDEGFAVYEYEWWHFDYRDWRHYPLMNVAFDRIR